MVKLYDPDAYVEATDGSGNIYRARCDDEFVVVTANNDLPGWAGPFPIPLSAELPSGIAATLNKQLKARGIVDP